jgi:DNA replication protein DnaC
LSEKIDKTLKKLANAMQNGKTPGETVNPKADYGPALDQGMLGDPNCPLCGGLGYLRQELPLGHPDFGKLTICSCRNAQISQQVRERLFSLSQLRELSELTFESFEPRGRIGLWPQQANSLEQAYNQAHLYAQSLKGWLLLQGRYGSGKTHLAAAIGNFAISVGVPTLFVTVPDLLDLLRYTYQDVGETFEERFEQIRQSPLLILDDFGTQNATPWATEKMFQIINYRYINKLPLVVTTNLDLRDIDERIRSRLEDPELVSKVRILATDYRNPANDMGYNELSSLDLLSHCTFASFDLRKGEDLSKTEHESLERAFAITLEYADDPHGWLLLTGPYGCGKTHLAAAIANYRVDKGNSQLFVIVSELLDHLRATFSPSSSVTLDRRFEEVKTAPLLILDDLGAHSMTPWVREKLYQLINFRYYAELPTVITTSDYREQMDQRLLSRLGDQRICTLCAITTPSYKGTSVRKSTKRAARKPAP